MKELLSKEHYCYKQNPYIISEGHCLPLPLPFIENRTLLQENLNPPFYDFSRLSTSPYL